MADVRVSLVSSVRERIARARGIAQAEVVWAERVTRAARTRLITLQRQWAGVTVSAQADRDARLAEAAARHERLLADLAVRASMVATGHPLAAASAPWSHWGPTPIGPAEAAPLVRIGRMLIGDVEVPALVPLLDRCHLRLHGSNRATIDQVLLTLLTRTLGSVPFGSVRLFSYDPEHLGGRLAAFAPLTGAELLSFSGPRALTPLLDALVEEAHRIGHHVLAGEYDSLCDRARRGEGRPEPWRLAVLLGDGSETSAHERAQLRRLIRTGVACGIHLITSDLPFGPLDHETIRDPVTFSPAAANVTTINIDANRAILDAYPMVHILLDRPPPVATVTDLARRIADRATAGPPPVALAWLLPDRDSYWAMRSANGLTVPIGESPAGEPVEVSLADQPPHALIGGPTGSGKTNLIYAWLASLTTRYSPRELELYLLDFKEGVSFARFAPTPRSPNWLPHVRLVGLNINTDREFGVALLRHLSAELRRRADAAKRCGVTKLSELREEHPSDDWPRIVAVIDEFQVLFGARDALTGQAVELLEDLARRGRSQGIHLVLASQDVSGIEALWGRSALLAQLTLRIALPKARRVLVETNPAADEIPRYHAVINTDSGVNAANQIVRMPEAGDRTAWNHLLETMTEAWTSQNGQRCPPRVFDGDAVPLLDEAPDFLSLKRGADGVTPIALLGDAIDVTARSAAIALPRTPGRNLAVLGTACAEARSILDSAARSLARQHEPGTARFSVGWFDRAPHPGATTLTEVLPPDTRWVGQDDLVELLRETTQALKAGETTPHFLLLYAVDAASQHLAVRAPQGTGHEMLRKVLAFGPEQGTHVLGWWRSVARLRDDLGGITARFDAIGSWVALNVHGGDLSPLSPAGPPTWYPRPWRALFFDRGTHRGAEVIVPYRETT